MYAHDRIYNPTEAVFHKRYGTLICNAQVRHARPSLFQANIYTYIIFSEQKHRTSVPIYTIIIVAFERLFVQKRFRDTIAAPTTRDDDGVLRPPDTYHIIILFIYIRTIVVKFV